MEVGRREGGGEGGREGAKACGQKWQHKCEGQERRIKHYMNECGLEE